MNSLDTARQGKSAARQIRAQMQAGVLSAPELDRLLAKVSEQGLPGLTPAERTQLQRISKRQKQRQEAEVG